MRRLLYSLAFMLPRDMRLEYRDEMISHACEDIRHGGSVAFLRACIDLIASGARERTAVLFRDLAYASSSIQKFPLFAIVVIGTLAISLSAVVTVLAALTAIFVRPLPFDQTSSLVVLYESSPAYDRLHLSLPDAEAVRTGTPGFVALAEYNYRSSTLSGMGPLRALDGGAVNDGFFSVYRWKPLLGRFISANDLRPGAEPVVVISYKLWQSAYQSSKDVIGRTADIGGIEYRVIGIAPENAFELNDQRDGITRSDYLIPLIASTYWHAGHNTTVIARLASGETIAHIDLELARVFAHLAKDHPDVDSGVVGYARNVEDALFGGVRPIAFVVAAIAFSIVLIACANVANLFLSRAPSRSSEIAIRVSVGASWRRVVSQLLTEAAVYVFAGSAAAIALAAAAVHLFGYYMTPYPAAFTVSLDFPTMLVTAGLAAFVTVASGLAPALVLAKPDASKTLKASGRGVITSGGRRIRALLAGGQLTLAIAICIAAALSVRTVFTMIALPLGFDPDNLSAVRIAGLSANVQLASKQMDQIRSRIAAEPGIRAAEWSTATPFLGEPDDTFHIAGSHTAPANDPDTSFGFVSNGFFSELRIPILVGRSFSARDREASAPVAVVNLAFARKFFGTATRALGKRVINGYGDPVEATIVGVVGNVRRSRSADFEPVLYLPIAQKRTLNEYLLVRAEPGISVMQAVRAATPTVGPLVMPRLVFPYATLLDNDIGPFRIVASLLTTLGAIAFLLSLAGVYAVVSYGVAQRTHEIGLRIALGARPRAIVAMVLSETVRMALPAGAAGILLGIAAADQLGAVLLGNVQFDASIYVFVVGAVGIATFAAAFSPAYRASRIVPINALRYE